VNQKLPFLGSYGLALVKDRESAVFALSAGNVNFQHSGLISFLHQHSLP